MKLREAFHDWGYAFFFGSSSRRHWHAKSKREALSKADPKSQTWACRMISVALAFTLKGAALTLAVNALQLFRVLSPHKMDSLLPMTPAHSALNSIHSGKTPLQSTHPKHPPVSAPLLPRLNKVTSLAQRIQSCV